MASLRIPPFLSAWVLTGLVLVLTGCAQPSGTVQNVSLTKSEKNARQFKQQKLALALRQDARNRLIRVALPLLQAGEPWCGSRVAPAYGWQLSSLHQYQEAWRRAAREQLGVQRRPTVIALAPGGPADRAGVQPGDVLIQLNGETLPKYPDSRGEPPLPIRNTTRQKLRNSSGTQTLTLRRNGSTRKLTIQPVSACSYRIRLEPGEIRNDFNDNSNIILSRNIVTFTRNEDELSVILAHLISHRLLNHSDKQFRNWISGVTVDMIAFSQGIPTLGTFGYLGNNRHSVLFEAEADYLALYLVARGGFTAERALTVWQRLAAARPSSIGEDFIRASYYTSIIDPPAFLEQHPLSTKRFQVMEAAVQRIAQQQESNQPLTPTEDIQSRLAYDGTDNPTPASPSHPQRIDSTSAEDPSAASESTEPASGSRTVKSPQTTSPPPEPAGAGPSDTGDGRFAFRKPGPYSLARDASDRHQSRQTSARNSKPADDRSVLVDETPVTRSDPSKPERGGNKKRNDSPTGVKQSTGNPASKGKPQSGSTRNRFTIQVGSYLNAAPARKQKQHLRSAGYAARIHRTVVHGTTYYRVVVGSFSNPQEARSRARQLTSNQGTVSSYWIRRLQSGARDQTLSRGEP